MEKTIELMIPFIDEEGHGDKEPKNFTVDFRFIGKHRPATREEPEEFPELEIISVKDEEGNEFDFEDYHEEIKSALSENDSMGGDGHDDWLQLLEERNQDLNEN